MHDLTHEELTRAARSWHEWGDESKPVAIDMVARATRLDATVVAANLALITSHACFLRADDAKKKRHARSMASRKGAKSQIYMREARGAKF